MLLFRTVLLHPLVAGTGDYIELLLLCQINKLHCIAGYPDRKVRILFLLRMLHCVDQLLTSKDIDIQMMCALIKVAVQYAYQIVLALFLIMSKCARINRLCVGNSIQSILIRQLCDRIQGCQQTVLLCTVARICTRSQRLSRPFLPSGILPVAFPYTTFEVIVRMEVVASESRYV